ncbi:uncharacterized protein LOC142317655 [Lycorma delicatula]|uniref:uncharacterized protein LOC142317655 n=1 Tax=Lycorma delicatula TaxID=130591 RepID=UPI003F51963F
MRLYMLIMDTPVPNRVNIKSENESDKTEEMPCFILPHFLTEQQTGSDQEIDIPCFGQVKKDPFHIDDGDIERDPLATEEISVIKSEDVKIKNEVETKESLIDDASLNLELEVENDSSFIPTVKTGDDDLTSTHVSCTLINCKKLKLPLITVSKYLRQFLHFDLVTASETVEEHTVHRYITYDKEVKNSIHDRVKENVDLRSDNLSKSKNNKNELIEQKGDVEEFILVNKLDLETRDRWEAYNTKRIMNEKIENLNDITSETSSSVLELQVTPYAFNDLMKFLNGQFVIQEVRE